MPVLILVIMQLPPLEASNKNVLFPKNGIPKVLCLRTKFVDEIVGNLTTEMIKSIYLRGPRGSGKTTLLKMLGNKLKEHGDVHWIDSAEDLNNLTDIRSLKNLINQAKGRNMYFLVDEAHTNKDSGKFVRLLKRSPKNVFVIGAGIETFNAASAVFFDNYPSSRMMVQNEDLSELVAYFSGDKTEHLENVRTICSYLLEFTGGHIFPLVKLCEYFLGSQQSFDLDSVKKDLAGKDFIESEVFDEIKDRCYQSVDERISDAADALFSARITSNGLRDLKKIGYWDEGKGQLISLLLTWSLFGLKKPTKVSPELIGQYDGKKLGEYKSLFGDFSDRELKQMLDVEKIIIAGLKNMEISDFYEPDGITVSYENPIGFRWSVYAQAAISNIYMHPQTQATIDKGRGARPTTDFYVNGTLDTAFELARDCDSNAIEMKLKRFTEKVGGHRQWENNFCILIFQLKKTAVDVPANCDKYKHRIYTFVKDKNALYRGNTEICKNVCKALPNKTGGVSMEAKSVVQQLSTISTTVNTSNKSVQTGKSNFSTYSRPFPASNVPSFPVSRLSFSNQKKFPAFVFKFLKWL
jgi:energy-coupling factor transporter ATP-binding protein EcfA2